MGRSFLVRDSGSPAGRGSPPARRSRDKRTRVTNNPAGRRPRPGVVIAGGGAVRSAAPRLSPRNEPSTPGQSAPVTRAASLTPLSVLFAQGNATFFPKRL